MLNPPPTVLGLGFAGPHDRPEKKEKQASPLVASLLGPVGSLWTRPATRTQPPGPVPSIPTTTKGQLSSLV